jgi:hypothetical protein
VLQVESSDPSALYWSFRQSWDDVDLLLQIGALPAPS